MLLGDMEKTSALSILNAFGGEEPALLPHAAVQSFEKLLFHEDERFWMEQGAQKALRIFHDAAVRVPAYRDFLKHAQVDHEHIVTIEDFAGVPITTPENYIAAYPLEKRCWDGKLSATQFVATSSGTKGEPKYWPRNGQQDYEQALTHEFLYRTCFQIDQRTTLLLIGFPMGIYISGMATVLPSWLTALEHPGLTVMSIGNNKSEMVRAVKNLSVSYEQTILIGHPFFIKDVIETGSREGIVWARKNLGLLFCSEGFTEEWRQYVGKKAGMHPADLRMFNTYGSSEMLLMAYETSMSIGVKALLERDADFLQALTGDPIAPQLFQYNPLLRYIESVEGELVFTCASGLPLIRFNLHDRGQVFSLQHVESVVHTSFKTSAGRSLRAKGTIAQLPLVALWGRSDHSLKFHGANIYPEHVKVGISDKQFLEALTGKFTLRKFLSRNMDQFLEINVELCPGIRESKQLKDQIQERIIETLYRVNLEYKDMSTHLKKDVRPRIVLRPYQHPRYFKPGLKPRYIAGK